MAVVLPQHVAAPAQTQRSTFTVETFFERILAAVNDEYGGLGSKSIYHAYANKLVQEKESVMASLKTNFDALVKNSLDNGYNLLSHASLGNLSDASIINVLNLDESEEHETDWINAHFTNTIAAINAHMADINSKIPDILKAKIKEIDDEFNKVLGDYAIDSSTLDPSSQLGIKIEEFKKDVEREFETFVGTPFDKYFYEKASFPIASKIAEEMAKKEFTDAIAPTVEQLITAAVQALSQRPGGDSRAYAEDAYNYFVNGNPLTWASFDTKYMSGIAAVINKYTHSGKIVIKPPNSHVTAGDDIFSILMKTKIEVTIGQTEFEINLKDMTLTKHSYALEALSRTAGIAFGSPGSNGIFPHITSFKAKVKDSITWTNGQEITEQDIKDNLVKGDSVDTWNRFFSELKIFQSSPLGQNTEVKYLYIDKQIHIKFIDNSISSTDFDFGDESPIDREDKKQYWFNRHESVEHDAKYDGIPQSIVFNNQHIFNFEIGVTLVSRIDEFASMLRDATKEPKQPDAVPTKMLLNADGTFKDLTKADLIEIFPALQAEFFDEFEKETTYSISYKSSEVSNDAHGDSVIEVKIKSPSVEKHLYVHVKTYNKDEIISKAAEALSAYENTWEDKTPSVTPASFGNPGPESFTAGTTPTKDILAHIFNGIDKYFVPIDQATPPGKVDLLKILPSSEETKESTLTMEMLESWNKDLIEELGGMTQEIRDTISLAISGASIFGKSKLSKYLYANVEMSQPSVKTYKMIAVHYLSEEQRFIEYNLIEQSMGLFATSYLQKIFREHDIPESIKQKVLKEFNDMSKPLLAQIKTILDPDNPNAEVPDFALHRVQNIIQDLKMNLQDIKDNYDLNEDDLKKLKTASKVFKYVLTSVGGLIGISALMALLIPIRTALGDRKLKKENPQAKRSSKKMIIVSAVSGLLAAGSSVAIMIYVFLTQGGL